LKFTVSLNYTSNFKLDKSDINSASKQYQNRVLSKNMIYFLLYFNKLCKTNDTYNNKVNFFFKPSKINSYTVLRAPYRYKISRNQIEIKRFNFICQNSFVLKNYKNLNVTSFSNIYEIANEVSSFFKDYSTNMCTQDKIKIRFSINFKDYFTFKNL